MRICTSRNCTWTEIVRKLFLKFFFFFDKLKISLIIACVQNLRVGHRPNLPAIYLYVFPSCSSKFTQLLAALVGNVNHILKVSLLSAWPERAIFFIWSKIIRIKTVLWVRICFENTQTCSQKTDSSLVTTFLLSSCAVQLRVNARSHRVSTFYLWNQKRKSFGKSIIVRFE